MGVGDLGGDGASMMTVVRQRCRRVDRDRFLASNSDDIMYTVLLPRVLCLPGIARLRNIHSLRLSPITKVGQ